MNDELIPPETIGISERGLDQSSKYFPIRRSTRLPLEIPVRITSTDPKKKFAEDCTTVTVSAHGCGVISARQLASGTPVQLEIVADKQSTPARILEVVPLNDEKTSWLLGMELEHPGNFWGIKYAPADWAEEDTQPAASPHPTSSLAADPPRTASQPATASPAPEPAPAAMSRVHIHRPVTASKPAPEVGIAAKSAATATHDTNPQAAPAKPAPAQKTAPPATKEIPAAVLRRLLSECRLAAISVGACYVQTGTTFPMHAPVKLIAHARNQQHSFHGTVRVEHVGAGMGIEFSGTGEEHASRIAALIEALSANSEKIPEVRVELAAPDKSGRSKSKSASAADAEFDSLLGLILVGATLKRSDFLQELENQRRRS
jgi:PilZ domain